MQQHLKILTKWVDTKSSPAQEIIRAWISKVKASFNMGLGLFLWQVIKQIMSIQTRFNILVVQVIQGKINFEAQAHFPRLMKLKDSYLR